jgi:nucleoside-diphosphate-sugar epimerase
MRVLMLGGTGLLSGAAREAFLATGHDVTVVVRGTHPLPPHDRLLVRRADRRDAASLGAALRGERYDFTVDFLGFDGDDVGRLFAAPGFGPGRLVLISTGQVYLVTREPRPPFREADADAPTIPEPVAGTRAWHNWVYGMGKRAAEAALARIGQERGVPVLALRLPVVQGEADGSASQRLWAWLERMRDGGPVLLPEDGVQPVRFVYSGDAAAALLRLAEHAAWPIEPALNLAQPSEEPLRVFLERVAACAGLTPRFVPVSATELEAAGLDESSAPYWGRWCSRPDPSAAFAALGFRTRGPAEYLPSVVAAHLAHPPTASHDGYVHRPAELALAARLARS